MLVHVARDCCVLEQVRVLRPDRAGLRGGGVEPERDGDRDGRGADRGDQHGAVARSQPGRADAGEHRERGCELDVVVRMEGAAAEHADDGSCEPQPHEPRRSAHAERGEQDERPQRA